MNTNGSRSGIVGVVVLVIVGALAANGANAQPTYEILESFGGSLFNDAFSLVRGSDGFLYGVWDSAGAKNLGLVYRVRPDGAGGFVVDEVHSFTGPDGALPFSRLLAASDGNLYGTTDDAGAFGSGTLFRIDACGVLTTLHHFDSGVRPSGPLAEGPGGSLYGTASAPVGNGEIFRVSSQGVFDVLHQFNGTDGSGPMGLIGASDGNFYGLTGGGGASSFGTAFRIDPAGNFASLHSFDAPTAPGGTLVEASDGNFYGVAPGDFNVMNYGHVFRMTPAGDVTSIHDFDGTDSAFPNSGLVQASDGNLYGTASRTPDPRSTIFRVSLAGSYQTVYTLTPGDGSYAWGPLVDRGDGYLYGLVSVTPVSSVPQVFRIDFAGNYSRIVGLTIKGPHRPDAALFQASDGNFYGTSALGGANDTGTLFRIDSVGVMTVLADFVGSNGRNPRAPLIQASDGNLYGTTSAGGAADKGTLYRFDLGSLQLTTLHEFDGTDGWQPLGALLEASDGNLYGTTLMGGAASHGNIFRSDLAGTFTPVHEFAPSEGRNPSGGLIEVGGSLFGLAGAGGDTDEGTMYRLDFNGTVTPLHSFAFATGSSPTGRLLAASNGFLYGTTSVGGPTGTYGTLFRTDTSGNVTQLYGFPDTGPGFPVGDLIEASDGYLYGTHGSGGTGGAIFQSDLNGAVTIVQDFTNAGGNFSQAGVIQGADGNLYGTTSTGGPEFTVGYGYGDGVVFRLWPVSPPASTLAGLSPPSGSSQGGALVTLQGAHWQPGAAVQVDGQPPVAIQYLDAQTIAAIFPPLSAGAFHQVDVANPALPAALPAEWFADFLDVPCTNLFHRDVLSIVRAGITAGCGGGNYCVTAPVTRAQMAVFLLKASLGAGYVPPPETGMVFLDVPVGSFAAAWIENLASLGITGGCGGGNYCPSAPVTRAQMAVFLLKTSLGTGYIPPTVAQIFGDVPPSAFAADWINDLYDRQITGGCSASPRLYCPGNSVSRGQMATFLSRTFALP